jgi:hypothetical protein
MGFDQALYDKISPYARYDEKKKMRP